MNQTILGNRINMNQLTLGNRMTLALVSLWVGMIFSSTNHGIPWALQPDFVAVAPPQHFEPQYFEEENLMRLDS